MKQAVLGIGNILLRDDGIGIRVVQELADKGTLTHVELVDGGTSTLDMLGLFLSHDRIIVVDSLRGGHPPGTIYRLTPEQLGSYMSGSSSLHEVQILDVVQLADMLGHSPEVLIIGIEPKEIELSMQLSPDIEALLPWLVDAVEFEPVSYSIGLMN